MNDGTITEKVAKSAIADAERLSKRVIDLEEQKLRAMEALRLADTYLAHNGYSETGIPRAKILEALKYANL